jgi:hypothetical protein
MALYQNRFIGTLPEGDTFTFSWWTDSTQDLATVQAGNVQWAQDLWAGASSGAGLQDLLPSSCVLTTVRTGLITQATGQQQAVDEDTVNLPGVATGNSLPNDVALVVSLRTNLANRRGRGRFYLPSLVATTLTAAGRLDPTAQQNIVDSLANAWNGYTGVGDPVVYSRTQRTIEDVISFDVGDLFDTQRRRENKVSQSRISAPMP